MQSEVIKAQEEAQGALKKEINNHQKLKLQLELNKTLSDNFQVQIEALQVEKAMLQSSTSDVCERPLHSFFCANYSTSKPKKRVFLLLIKLTFFFDSGKLWTMPPRMVFIEHIMLLPFKITIQSFKELVRQQSRLYQSWGRPGCD